jgi:hypothetical protein
MLLVAIRITANGSRHQQQCQQQQETGLGYAAVISADHTRDKELVLGVESGDGEVLAGEGGCLSGDDLLLCQHVSCGVQETTCDGMVATCSACNGEPTQRASTGKRWFRRAELR